MKSGEKMKSGFWKCIVRHEQLKIENDNGKNIDMQ